MTPRALSSYATLGVTLTLLSCRSLDRFDTKDKAAYCGQLVSAPTFQDGFVPDGEPGVLLTMKLTLDTSQLSSYSADKVTQLGALTSNDADRGLCTSNGQALFESSPVRGIPQLDHDTLSALTFGEGHDEDLFAYVDSTCQGTMVAVVSLLRKGDVELRLFKPAALPSRDAAADRRPGFGLFYLKRQEKGCGFERPDYGLGHRNIVRRDGRRGRALER
jgi:hypothetical protein